MLGHVTKDINMSKKRIIILSCCAFGLLLVLFTPFFTRGGRYEALNAACWRGDVGRVRLLLALGADPNGESDYNCNPCLEFSYPIDGAAWNNHAEIIHLLVKAGASVNVPDSEGGSPLCTAAREGSTDAAKTLLNYGARITTDDGTSVLTVARRFGHEDIARLIEASPQFQKHQ